VQVVFLFPAKFWVAMLCGREDVVKYLGTPWHMHPPGSVQRSRGWQKKMVADPLMDGVRLKMGVSGTTDGVPYFKDMHRSGWPSTLCAAALPQALAQSATNIHLHTLTPSEYFEVDGTRVIREPHSLTIIIDWVARDLDALYWDGQYVPDGCGGMELCRTKLLLWNGDYPGIGKASNFVHGNSKWFCHWYVT
jgi:hypothetical protein